MSKNDVRKLHAVMAVESQRGVSMIEVLVSIALIGLIAGSINTITSMSLKLSHRTYIAQIMNNLAIEKLEEIAGINAVDLTEANDETENNISVSSTNAQFTRVTNVTILADDTRQVQVTVSSNLEDAPAPVSYDASFALWE